VHTSVADVETPGAEEVRAERRGAANCEVSAGREVLRAATAQIRPHEREPHRVRDEVEDEAAVGESPRGAAKEGLAVGLPECGLAGAVAVVESEVAGIGQRVPEAEHARVTRQRRFRPN